MVAVFREFHVLSGKREMDEVFANINVYVSLKVYTHNMLDFCVWFLWKVITTLISTLQMRYSLHQILFFFYVNYLHILHDLDNK